MDDQATADVGEDLIWGVDGANGIAAFLGIDVRRAYYLIRRGRIPVRHHGHRTVTASRSELRALFGMSDRPPLAR
jgi:hypothetical protein